MGSAGRTTCVARLAPVRLSRPTVPRLAPPALLACFLLTVASCTGARPQLADEVDTSADPSTTTEPAASVEAAQAIGDGIDIYESAGATDPSQTITIAEASPTPDIPITFLVIGRSGDRIEVQLPVAPPGSTGWVNTSDVTLSTIDFRVEVSLSERWIRVHELDQVVLDEQVGVGQSDQPDAGVRYYLTALLQPPDPTGPYGTYAYGLSGFATSLNSFESGEGLVGLHGTDDESAIGGDVPTGSILLADTVLDRLVNEIGLPLGTPVEILP